MKPSERITEIYNEIDKNEPMNLTIESNSVLLFITRTMRATLQYLDEQHELKK